MTPGISVAVGELTVTYFDDRVVVAGPPAAGPVEALRPDPETVHALARTDALGRYRPLTGLRGLRGGWEVTCTTLSEADAVVEGIYPLALDHLSQAADGALRVVLLDDVLGRQTGRYARAAALGAGGRQLVTALLCGACVRAPVWAGRSPAEGEIPCPEACSMVVAFCREAAIWEEAPPLPSPASTNIPLAAFEQPGNPFREAYLAHRSPPR